jgi:hypothetical protein
MIADYVDLNVQTGNKNAKMQFLVTNLGLEDLILGYPWLANFEQKFSWKEAVIDMSHLPMIIQSLSWHQTTQSTISNMMVARLVTEPLSDMEKDLIVQDLEAESSWHCNISTQLAQDAGQYTPAVAIPDEYQRHAKVFSKEEAR